MTFFNSHFCGFDKKPLVQSPRKIRKAAYTHISGFRKLLETLQRNLQKNVNPSSFPESLCWGLILLKTLLLLHKWLSKSLKPIGFQQITLLQKQKRFPSTDENVTQRVSISWMQSNFSMHTHEELTLFWRVFPIAFLTQYVFIEVLRKNRLMLIKATSLTDKQKS